MLRGLEEDQPLFSTRSLEGEYIAWALTWTRDYGAAVALDSVIVDNQGSVYVLDVTAGNSYFRDFYGNEINTANYVYCIGIPFPSMRGFSDTRKYVLGLNLGVPIQIDIWRDGAIIANINVFTDNADAAGVIEASISPDGKFIAVVVSSTATANNRYVMLYEGV